VRFITRFFSPSSIKTATWLLTVATFLSYLAGFFRDLIIAYSFGATAQTDAYFAAFLIPDLIFAFSAGGFLSGIFLKVYAEQKAKDLISGQKLMGSFLFWVMIFVLLVCGIVFYFMPTIVPFVFDSASLDVSKNIVYFSRILLMSPIIFTISNFFGSVLMDSKHYLSYALSPFFYNIGIILATLIFGPTLGIKAAVYGVVFGLFLHLLVRFWDFRYADIQFRFELFHSKLKKLIILSLPKIFGLLSLQLTLLFFTKLAIGFGDGVNTAFNLARNVQSFAVSLFGISFATAVYPFMLDLVHKRDFKVLATQLEDSILKIACYSLAAMFGMLVLVKPMVAGLFQYGSFTQAAVDYTVAILVALLVAIPFEALNHLYSRVYYAFANTIKPVIISQLFLITATVGAYFFADKIGVIAFGLFFALGIMIQNLFLLIFLRGYVKIPFLDLFPKLLKLVLACIIMVVAVYPLTLLNLPALVILMLASLVGALVYFYCLHLLNMFQYTGINLKAFYVRIFS